MERINNMFKFATKELSQDAFLCWLVNYINTDEEYKIVAKDFMKLLVHKIGNKSLEDVINKDTYTVQIKHQYKNIDILLEIEGFYIIIEDKIKTLEHDNQINSYENKLIAQGINKNNIFTCYYKIYDEYKIKDKFIGAVITRKDMINLFENAKNINLFMSDYLNYLKEIEEYSSKRNIVAKDLSNLDAKYVNKVEDSIYTSFYSELENKQKDIVGWGYADNRAGGTWWYASEKYNNVQSEEFERIYAEINLKEERNQIVIKLGKKSKYLDLSVNEKIENALKDKEYYEKGKIKYFDRKKYFVVADDKNNIEEIFEYWCYKNLTNKIDIFDKVITKELLEKLKSYGIEMNDNSKGVLKKDNNIPYKYYARIASINVNDYTLEEIEEILNTINEHLKCIKIKL